MIKYELKMKIHQIQKRVSMNTVSPFLSSKKRTVVSKRATPIEKEEPIQSNISDEAQEKQAGSEPIHMTLTAL